MDKNKINQINIKALNLNDSVKVLDDSSDLLLIEDAPKFGKKKYYEYKTHNTNQIIVSIYDSIKDDQEIRRAAEFLCSFDDTDILESFCKKTYESNGKIKETINTKSE